MMIRTQLPHRYNLQHDSRSEDALHPTEQSSHTQVWYHFQNDTVPSMYTDDLHSENRPSTWIRSESRNEYHNEQRAY